MAYTYLIGWSKLNKWYYGLRYARNCKPEELWINYFTSSKHVHTFRKEHGEPDVIQIRKVFDFKEKAILWEHNVLTRLNVIENEKWLNKTNNKTICPEAARNALIGRKPWNKGKSIPRTKESIEKQRKTMTGKKRGPYNNYNYDVSATAVAFRGKEYPSIAAARKDTGASFYTVKRYAISTASSRARVFNPLLVPYQAD